MDCGTAIGRLLGNDPSFFNLWGEAVRTAQIMAASALPGAIQASEVLRLRQGSLLRPRGTFYLPTVGAWQTFVLSGRLNLAGVEHEGLACRRARQFATAGPASKIW
jgi:adenylate cyclase